MTDGQPLDPHLVAQVNRVKRDATAALLALPGVNLVGIGAKQIGGRFTGELAIHVYVDVKLPLDDVPPEQRIPPEIDGVPTDVFVGGDLSPAAPAPPAHGSKTTADTVKTRHRPAVLGGALIKAQHSLQEGTMGCLLTDPANAQIGYGVTAHHVMRTPPDPAPVAGTTKVGQPTNKSSSTACCDDIIGTYAGGAETDVLRDEALFRLDPGTKFLCEIVGLGFVTGARPIVEADVTGHLQVRKSGARTRLTGGFIQTIMATAATPGADQVLVIHPNPLPGERSGDIVFFADKGDSGCVVVDAVNAESCQVIGLLFAQDKTRAQKQALGRPVPPLPADGIERNLAYVYPIADVIRRFKDNENITVVLGTATAAGQVHTVPGGSSVAVPSEIADRIMAEPAARASFVGDGDGDGLRAPVGRAWFAEGRPPEEALAALRDGLDATETGRTLISFWLAHHAELDHLVRTDRRVTIAWHRGGGSALLQLLTRMVSRPELELPMTVGGRPVMDCLDELIAVVSARCGPGLRTDLERVRRVLPDPGGRTLPEIIFALGATPQEVGGDG